MRSYTWLVCFAAGLAVQAGAYWYLDGVLFAPNSDFYVSGTKEEGPETVTNFGEVAGNGTRYYSHDHQYMALVTPTSVVIHSQQSKDVQRINLKGKEVSFFEWLPDRNLVLMALFDPKARGTDDLVIAQYNPLTPDHELDTPIEGVPAGSKVTSMAYSTATNVVYMKVRLDEGRYRIYRTDANYDTRRIYAQAENIGRIGVFYDEDIFFYDDADTGTMYAFKGTDSSWRIISPPGSFRLIGVDNQKNIYAARVDKDGKAMELYSGRLGVGFHSVAKLTERVPFDQVTIDFVQEQEKLAADTNTSQKKVR